MLSKRVEDSSLFLSFSKIDEGICTETVHPMVKTKTLLTRVMLLSYLFEFSLILVVLASRNCAPIFLTIFSLSTKSLKLDETEVNAGAVYKFFFDQNN